MIPVDDGRLIMLYRCCRCRLPEDMSFYHFNTHHAFHFAMRQDVYFGIIATGDASYTPMSGHLRLHDRKAIYNELFHFTASLLSVTRDDDYLIDAILFSR